jgi:hypothetical protein
MVRPNPRMQRTGRACAEVVVLNWLAKVRSRIDLRTTGRTRD